MPYILYHTLWRSPNLLKTDAYPDNLSYIFISRESKGTKNHRTHHSQVRTHPMHDRNRARRQAAHFCDYHVDVLSRGHVVHDVQEL